MSDLPSTAAPSGHSTESSSGCGGASSPPALALTNQWQRRRCVKFAAFRCLAWPSGWPRNASGRIVTGVSSRRRFRTTRSITVRCAAAGRRNDPSASQTREAGLSPAPTPPSAETAPSRHLPDTTGNAEFNRCSPGQCRMDRSCPGCFREPRTGLGSRCRWLCRCRRRCQGRHPRYCPPPRTGSRSLCRR
jgi:hypothetical protein